MKIVYNKETRRFGFVFDRFRKIGDTLPFESVEDFAECLYLSFLQTFNVIDKVSIHPSSWEHTDKMSRKLIAIYGENADTSLTTMSLQVILPDFDNSMSKFTYYLIKRPNLIKKSLYNHYDDICNRPMAELTRSVGSGVEGIAMTSGILGFGDGGSFIKKSYPGGMKQIQYDFYEYCKQNKGTEYLPIVGSVTYDSVFIEKLKVGTKKCYEFSELLNRAKTDVETNDKKSIDKEPRKIKKCIDILNAMCESIGLKDFTWLDIHEGNLGERADGSIVIFDPIGPMMGDKTAKINNRYVPKLKKLLEVKKK